MKFETRSDSIITKYSLSYLISSSEEVAHEDDTCTNGAAEGALIEMEKLYDTHMGVFIPHMTKAHFKSESDAHALGLAAYIDALGEHMLTIAYILAMNPYGLSSDSIRKLLTHLREASITGFSEGKTYREERIKQRQAFPSQDQSPIFPLPPKAND